MKRDHLSLAAGFLPGLSLLIVLVCRRYVQGGANLPQWAAAIPLEWLWVMVEMLVFFLPYAILLFLCSRKEDISLKPRLQPISVGSIPMLLTLGVTMALVNLLLGDIIATMAGKSYADVQVFSPLLQGQPSVIAIIVAITVVPVIGGQLLFTEGLMRVYAPGGGLPALMICALGYSLLTGTPETLAGTFLGMLVFFYVSWTMNSMWVGLLVHGTYSFVHLLLLFVAGAYSGHELWRVVQLVMIFLFGLFLYLSMHSMEQLMEKGMLRRLERIRRENLLNSIVFSPGLWMTVFLFVINWLT